MAEIQNHKLDPSVTTSAHAQQHDAALSKPISDATPTTTATATSQSTPRPRKPNMNELYNQPAPLRVFPFPTLTSNPVSWVHLALTWLVQTLSPPPPEPSVIHTAYWDLATQSIIVTDEKAVAALWQQGFYGKGSLSRSEPNWLKREEIRRGVAQGRVAEVNTDKRREDRARVKWERARAEEEARVQRRLEEARLLGAVAEAVAEPEAVELVAPAAVPVSAELAPAAVPVCMESAAPVGPLELLALPNSLAELIAQIPRSDDKVYAPAPLRLDHLAPVGPSELLALPNSLAELIARTGRSEDSMAATEASLDESASSGNDDADSNTTVSSDSTGLKRRKSVRFSPNVESTVFQHTDPPSPPRSVSSSSLKMNGVATEQQPEPAELSLQATPETVKSSLEVITLVNKEHLQLSAQEAFFLVFGLGALKVVDAATQAPIPTPELLTLFRQLSYYPPRTPEALEPDDPFMINYAVYHHFRSLGWVPRGGVKFGVDWLLYTRGPVFDHAEYGLLVLPSYSHAYWKAQGRQAPRKTWHWLMGVNRVLSKVYKSLVLVYVEIPPPSAFAENGGGLVEVLGGYRIREMMIKRWSSNRNRDLK